MTRYRKHKRGRAKGKVYAFRNTRGAIGDDLGPLGGSDSVTEDRRLTSDTAIGTNTSLTHKQKHFIGRKDRITNTKGEGDRLL
jgi:hypothetical protein